MVRTLKAVTPYDVDPLIGLLCRPVGVQPKRDRDLGSAHQTRGDAAGIQSS